MSPYAIIDGASLAHADTPKSSRPEALEVTKLVRASYRTSLECKGSSL